MENRVRVKHAASIGMSEDDIALLLGVPVKEVKMQYAADYKLGKAEGTLAILDKLYEKALDGDYRSIELFLKVFGNKEINKMDDIEVDYSNLIEATNAYNTLIKCSKS